MYNNDGMEHLEYRAEEEQGKKLYYKDVKAILDLMNEFMDTKGEELGGR